MKRIINKDFEIPFKPEDWGFEFDGRYYSHEDGYMFRVKDNALIHKGEEYKCDTVGDYRAFWNTFFSDEAKRREFYGVDLKEEIKAALDKNTQDAKNLQNFYDKGEPYPFIEGVMHFDKEGNFKAKKLPDELIPGFKDFSSIQDEAIKRLHKDLSDNLEDQIILALSRHGFTFDTRRELEEFCVNPRCEMQIRDNIKTLLVDGKPICQWDMNPKIENNFTDRKYSITAEYNQFKIFEV
ncbi:hypothetical protein [Salinimicrobium sp. GXAS 041]|uniref:hypothetical protein n=1 Tax=Salinimicrobium sp. GXAS 041 TaxID=3400806 RepID=UPI003C72F0E1